MAIASTLDQQRKCLRCHMKPASFFLHVFFLTDIRLHMLGHNCCLKNTYFFILFSKKIVIFAGKNIKSE